MPRYIALYVYLLTAVVLFCADSSASEPPPAVDVTLSSPKHRYVMGEPVVLDVQVTNRGPQPIEAYKVTAIDYPICPEIAIYVSSKEFTPAPCDDPDVVRKADTLGPGDTWKYQLRIVYGDATARQLPLPKVGEYTIRVEYPLLVAQPGTFGAVDATRSGRYDSNTIKVQVVDVIGRDARIWQTLQSPGFRFFMQWGTVTEEHSDVPLRAAELLNTESRSSYHDGLRWALREYYQRRKAELSEYEAELIRQVARLETPLPDPILFADDARLDQVITYHFPNQTALKEVLRKAARQGGISLELHPELQKRTMASARVTEPLRTFLRKVATPGASWIRKGDGYLLAPEEPGE